MKAIFRVQLAVVGGLGGKVVEDVVGAADALSSSKELIVQTN